MYVVCHDGTNIKKGQQGTIYVASTMQTATVKNIKEKVCMHPHYVSLCLRQDDVTIGKPLSRCSQPC